MADLIFSLDQEIKREELFLVVKIEDKSDPMRRLLYKDSLQKMATSKNQAALLFLIQEELRFLGLSSSSSQASTTPFNRIRIAKEKSNQALKLLAETDRLFWKGQKLFIDRYTALDFQYEVHTLEEEEGGTIKGLLIHPGKTEDLITCDWIFPGAPLWLICKGVVHMFKEAIDWKWIQMVFPEKAVLKGSKWERFLVDFEEDPPPRAPKVIWTNIPKPLVEGNPDILPFLVLKDRSGAFADLWMNYGKERKIAIHEFATPAWRNLAAEKAWEKDLLETDFIKKIVDMSHYYCPIDKVAKSLTFLLEIGWTLFDHRGKQILRQEEAALAMKMQTDVITIEGKIAYGSHVADLKHVVGAFNRREHFVDLSEHHVGLIDSAKIEKEWGEVDSYELVATGIAVKKNHVGVLESFFAKKEMVYDEKSRECLALLDKNSKMERTDLTARFCGKLYPYQQDGLDWLAFLHKASFHGLLADEMGLGKTVQILAFFSQLASSSSILIVAPTSLLFNWRKEIEKFLPNFPIYIHSGMERLQEAKALQEKKVILTSYALLRRDVTLLQELYYDCIVLDEAQVIKNPESAVAEAAFSLRAKMRLAITGTPVENHARDLWSLFHFLMPGLLGDLKHFQACLLAADGDKRHLNQIKRKVRPFILRRLKSEIEEQLAVKEEQVIWVEMPESQRALYESWMTKHRSGLLKKVQQDGVSAHRMEILEAILRLRQICCHPWLVDPSLEGEALELSGKMDLVIQDLEAIVKEGRKALIYSQFTTMLKILEKTIKSQGWSYVYLDGSSKDRESLVDTFQKDAQTSLFLISLKAGGVGLNLSAADYVLIFDPWWNEAVEQQAIDRAHRIDRKGTVIARRYVTALSIEEKMMRLKAHKTSLARGLLEFETHISQLTVEDLYELLT